MANRAVNSRLGVRVKETDVENSLPPISELLAQQDRKVYHYENLSGERVNVDLEPLVHRDLMRLPLPIDREGYCLENKTPRYWFTGLADWLNVQEAVQRFGSGSRERLRVLDFGCASGRFLRHVWQDRREWIADIWGCDYSPQNVDWCQRYLEPEIKVILNHEVPHLPFADGYFDLITAFSVFTHIDQLADAWLLELRRITRPGGLLYITFANQATWNKVLGRAQEFKWLQKANKFSVNSIVVDEQLFASPMPAERIAWQMNDDPVYNKNVWFTDEYVHRHWGRFLNVREIVDCGHLSYQSVAILQVP